MMPKRHHGRGFTQSQENLRDNWLLITGAGGGLGKAFALECAAAGYGLILTDLASSALEALAATIRRLYAVPVAVLFADLTRDGDREGLLGAIAQRGLRLCGLINVAGLDYEGVFLQREPAQIRTMLRLNVEAGLELTLGALKLRRQGQRLMVLNVGSLAAYFPMPYKAMYAAGKRMVLDFSLALREELRGENVTVTVLCPAGMPTNAEVVRSIGAQGWMGEMTTWNVGDVARRALRAAQRGRRVCIPGWINRVLVHLGGLLPAWLIARLVGLRWGHTRRALASRANLNPASKGG